MTVKTTIIGDRCVLYGADCLRVLRCMPSNSVDSIVTDPPAGVNFMGEDWDKAKGGRDAWIAWMQEIAAECLRVIKDGGHALVWALPRTSHWTGMAWENAGFEPRDRIAHLFSTGMPKSHNLKGEWDGWGTALKPSAEDWWLLRKPIKTSVAANAAKNGTGALHIDACRVPYQEGEVRIGEADMHKEEGRWPANTILDGSEEVIEMFPSDNKGSFSRFFYCAKASVKDREEGLDDLPLQILAYSNGAQAAVNDGAAEYTGGSQNIGFNNIKQRKNPHPTVKNTELMRYLARLITPAEGVCLDPFMGSGSTGKACMLEGFRFIGIEKEHDYLAVAEGRIRHAFEQTANQEK